MVNSRIARCTTKELSKKTWPDFEWFFSQGNGWDFCGCMVFQRGHHLARSELRTRAEQQVRNHRDKKGLVEQGRAHGILVYANGEPIGWCQYGPLDELPIGDTGLREKPRLPTGQGTGKQWRITCFVTDKQHRSQGVAGVALRAALEAIRKKGGGLVEAYPAAHAPGDPERDERQVRIRQWWKTTGQLQRTHGKESEEFCRHLLSAEPRTGLDRVGGGARVVVEGVGPAYGMYRVDYCGTVAMFEREGFKAVALFPVSERVRTPGPHPSRVVMRRSV